MLQRAGCTGGFEFANNEQRASRVQIQGLDPRLQVRLTTGRKARPAAVELPLRPIGIGAAGEVHGERLAGDGITVLQAAEADMARHNPGVSGQVSGHVEGIEAALFDFEPEVFAVAAGTVAELCNDAEILWLDLDPAAATGLTVAVLSHRRRPHRSPPRASA